MRCLSTRLFPQLLDGFVIGGRNGRCTLLEVAGESAHARVHFRKPGCDSRIGLRGFPEMARDLIDPVAGVADEKTVVPSVDSGDDSIEQVSPLPEGAHLEVIGQDDR